MLNKEKKPGFKLLRFASVFNAARRGLDEVSVPPLDYHFEVTNRCNIRCRTCARLYDPGFRVKGATGDMSLETFRKVEPWLRQSFKVNTVGFGEPFLNPHIIEIMEASASADNYITVITNGTLFDGDSIKRIVNMGLDVLVVSMDGGTPEVFEDIRRGAKWDQVLKALDELNTYKKEVRASRPSITVEFVALKNNFPTLPRLVDIVADRGVKKLHIEPLIRGGNDSYLSFYGEQSLAHIPLEEVRKIFEDVMMRAAARSLRLRGAFIKAGIDQIWQDSRIWALGHLDHPDPGTPPAEVYNVSGWCMHPSGIEKVAIMKQEVEIASSKPDVSRPDVAAAISGDFPGKSQCGFRFEVPESERGGSEPLEIVVFDKMGGKTVFGRFEGKGDAETGDEKPSTPPPSVRAPPKRGRLPYCTEPWTTFYVSWDGKVFPCCAAQGEPLGDLTKENLPAIWNGERYRALRRAISRQKVHDLCLHCVSNQRTLTKSLWAQFLPVFLPRGSKPRIVE